MTPLRLEHEYDCDAETFFREVLFNAPFNEKLFLEHLAFDGWKVLEHDESDTEIRRKIEVRPVTGEIPAAAAKVIGDNFGYVEAGTFDKAAGAYRFTITPHTLSKKVSIAGTITAQSLGDSRCRRVLDLEVNVRVLGLGKLVEKRICDDTRASYDKSYDYTQRHLRDVAGSEAP